MNLKVVIALVVWSFELLKTPPALSSYDGLDMFAHCHSNAL
jgi:hypothetical protein